ncbi:probable LRR receptor-like serine/threonine-protein kinase At2g16250 [Coffea arabica]|uniref:Probable LRR receptor-like serine/threonine-protein kinase At2g16250 n=1 Tax=Coffea arabica TaxID=13443 RepID=A0A6P6VRY4_COFAR|nr:probable LRR receptor-like serine/threonine-protein kinase At2g16250 [Coffea arabica]XP_027112283.1 probable LRR receptor-like serine/threonine-protein kinase At2g16250 [Coffea arabica]
MSRVYDNWERLVRATLRREELKLSGQRTPSELSLASLSASSSFSFTASSARISSFNFSSFLAGESFSYHQILLATDYFNESSNLIKHGHSGDLFYGTLQGGTPVVVKKIDLSLVKNESYFVEQLEIFGKLSHSRLVPLLGHCLDQGDDKFLVYKYMSNKDLSTSLILELDSEDDDLLLPTLDWKTRLKIATGVAEALFYLHHQCIPPLVHRDIQASSILLDDNFEICLGSLTEVCTAQVKDGNQNRIARFLRLPKGAAQGTSGTSKATIAYDIYCFGKVLLELITGKPSLSVLLERVTSKLDLTAASGYPVRPETVPVTVGADHHSVPGKSDPPDEEDWMADVLPYLTMYDDRKFVLKIVDNSLNIDHEDLLMEVWAVAMVAKACLNPKPSRRPWMTQVLEALRNPLKVATEEGRLWGWLSTSNGTSPSSSVLPPPVKKNEPPAALRSAELELEFY